MYKIPSNRQAVIFLSCMALRYSCIVLNRATIAFPILVIALPSCLRSNQNLRSVSELINICKKKINFTKWSFVVFFALVSPSSLLASSAFHARRKFEAFSNKCCPDSGCGKSKHNQVSQIILHEKNVELNMVCYVSSSLTKVQQTSKMSNLYQLNVQKVVMSVLQAFEECS